VLVEVHSHSLFSKWFSESGKLVARLFEHIQELVEDQGTLCCVLIDEVESLTAARTSAMNGAEPSDAVRVVNAMLTQLDTLKRFPNVITLCTSNLAEAIDVAFIDRADIKQYIGLPPVQARYTILRSAMLELMRVGIVAPAADVATMAELQLDSAKQADSLEALLFDVAVKAAELSGRTLRKLPFLAHASYVQQAQCSPLEYVRAMDAAVQDELADRADLGAEEDR
jgi:pachytene checkpoint protein 2